MYTVKTYETPSREEVEAAGVDWDALTARLKEWGPIVEDAFSADEVEESPPTIRYGEEFVPGGWVGEYTDRLRVVPRKVTSDTYDSLLKGTAGLIEWLGLPTAAAGFPFAPDVLYRYQTQLLSYSRDLIQITETLLETRLPVVIEREQHVGHNTVGNIDVKRTLREQAQHTGRIASQTINFSLETPTVRLLHRFHRILNGELLALHDEFNLGRVDSLSDRLQRQAAYHQRIRQAELPGDPAVMNEPVSSEAVSQLTESQAPPLRDLARLWMAYNRDQARSIDWQQQLDESVKPVSAVYELWCLQTLLDILTDQFGAYTTNNTQRLPSAYDFGAVTLYYDRKRRPLSTHLQEHYLPGSRKAGKPDFMLTETIDAGEIPRWVGDAKFQSAADLDTSGVLRFLGYLVDYLPRNGGSGTLLCVKDTPAVPARSVEGRESRIRRLCPELPSGRTALRDDITRSLTV